MNLQRASVLILDDDPTSLAIVVQIITGLGAKTLHRCSSVEHARTVAQSQDIDLAIVDSLVSGDGYDFVSWMRREAREPNCFAPVIVTTGHTPGRDIVRARDCGSHIIIKKPIAPIILLERILWVSKGGRPFLYSDAYVGPDRRFRDAGAPASGGRRREDSAVDLVPPAVAGTAGATEVAQSREAI